MKTTKEQFLDAIAKIDKLSPAPRILAKALGLLRNPDSSIDDIAVLIRTDTALTAQIIRGANSAFYGSEERVSSLDQAVQRIGFRESIRLLNLATARIVSGRGLDNYGIAAEAFWAESLFNGLVLQELAKAAGVSDPDEAHTAGLLRFIGRLAINQSIEELGCGLFWDGSSNLEAWEMENVGFPQSHAGAILLRKWQFSEPMVQAIEWQNEPERASGSPWLVAALQFVASLLPAGIGGAAVVPDSAPLPVPETAFSRQYGFDAGRMAEILSAARASFTAINQGLGGF